MCEEPSPEHHGPGAISSIESFVSDVRELGCTELINDFALFQCRRRDM